MRIPACGSVPSVQREWSSKLRAICSGNSDHVANVIWDHGFRCPLGAVRGVTVFRRARRSFSAVGVAAFLRASCERLLRVVSSGDRSWVLAFGVLGHNEWSGKTTGNRSMGGGGCAGLTHRLLPAAGGHGSLRHLTPSEYARKGKWRRGLLGEIAQGAGPQISRFPLLRSHAGDRFGARSVEMLRTPLRFLGSGRGSVGDQAAW